MKGKLYAILFLSLVIIIIGCGGETNAWSILSKYENKNITELKNESSILKWDGLLAKNTEKSLTGLTEMELEPIKEKLGKLGWFEGTIVEVLKR